MSAIFSQCFTMMLSWIIVVSVCTEMIAKATPMTSGTTTYYSSTPKVTSESSLPVPTPPVTSEKIENPSETVMTISTHSVITELDNVTSSDSSEYNISNGTTTSVYNYVTAHDNNTIMTTSSHADVTKLDRKVTGSDSNESFSDYNTTEPPDSVTNLVKENVSSKYNVTDMGYNMTKNQLNFTDTVGINENISITTIPTTKYTASPRARETYISHRKTTQNRHMFKRTTTLNTHIAKHSTVKNIMTSSVKPKDGKFSTAIDPLKVIIPIVAVGLVCVIIVIVCCCRKRRQKKKPSPFTEEVKNPVVNNEYVQMTKKAQSNENLHTTGEDRPSLDTDLKHTNRLTLGDQANLADTEHVMSTFGKDSQPKSSRKRHDYEDANNMNFLGQFQTPPEDRKHTEENVQQEPMPDGQRHSSVTYQSKHRSYITEL